MKKLERNEGAGPNVIEENTNALRNLFPDAFTEDGLSFEILQQLLGGTVAENEEKFGLNWHGKKNARQLAQTDASGTLRPCPEESIDWDYTKNLFIEGENYEVLKQLRNSYGRKVKLIYIDPPYNTNGDFIYSDSFQERADTYLENTGQIDKNGQKLTSNRETNGRKHTNWLNMMLPRLKLASSLLSNDGLLLCHIDEHEFSNLCYLLDEIFGPENNLGPIIWDKKNPKGDATNIATQHEYIVLYAKNAEALKESTPLERPKANAVKILNKAAKLFKQKGKITPPADLSEIAEKYNLSIDLDEYAQEYDHEQMNADFCYWLSRQPVSGGEAAYKFIDEEGQVYQSVHMGWPNNKQAPKEYMIPLTHPVTGRECPIPEKGWRYPPATMNELLKRGQIIFGKDEKTVPRRKYILSENMKENIPSIISYGKSDDKLLSKLGIPFENPKPVEFIRDLLSCFLSDGDMVVDFFAGSASVAHAAMKLSAETNREIRYVMIQIPEEFDSKKSKKAASLCNEIGKPHNIAEVSKERIRRSIDLLKKEFPEYSGDLGFKVFKWDCSNFRTWNVEGDDLEQPLLDSVDNIIPGRSEQDILYELLLMQSFELEVPIQQKHIEGKLVFCVNHGVLIACLDGSINNSEVEALGKGISKWIEELKPATEATVVFRDNAFEDDMAKINMTTILELSGINHVRSL